LGLDFKDDSCCGFLFVQLQDTTDSGIYFFRNERIKSILWAGQPKKASDNGGNLTPRSSFLQYQEVMKGRSKKWTNLLLEHAVQIQKAVTRYLLRWKSEKHRVDADRKKEDIERFQRENEVTRQSIITQNNFLTTISHELRTPPHSILGNAEKLIEIRTTDSDSQQACAMIRNSGEHLLALISDILDLSKLESNRMEINPIAFDPYQRMEFLVHSLYPVASDKGIYLILLMPVRFPILFGDSVRVGQIILNFLSNACKFTSKGGVTVAVTETARDSKIVKLRFTVTDTGPGIPPDSLSKLFQRFSQLEVGKRHEGAGLGLLISKQLAELMGGSVGVESTPGEGSTFSLQLQLEVRPSSPTASSNRLATLERPNGKQLVLVCESREYVVRFLRYHLEQWGISVHHATSQEETISQTLNERSLFAVFLGEEGEPTQTARDGVKAATSRIEGHSSLREILMRWPSVRGVLIQPSEPRQATIRSETETWFPVLNLPLSIHQLHQILSPQRQRGGTELTPSTPKSNHSNCSIEGLHVLIVEDNLSNQAIVKMFLSKLKHTYDIVGDGLSAITAVTNNHYDAVLMDVMMPVMDGITATLRIRSEERLKLSRPIVIVGLTATSESSLVEECLKSGMNACLSKPFKCIELQQTLGKLFENGEVGSKRESTQKPQ